MVYTVCKSEDIEKGQMRAVTVDGKSIVVARTQKGEVYALRNVCPHKGPALSDGSLDGTCFSDTAGEYQLENAGEVLKCPWHNWEFDIKTGCSIFDPENVRVKTFEVTEAEGKVLLKL
jgi:nitrite reductase/ring-hydroxylating ferredoxin subunit